MGASASSSWADDPFMRSDRVPQVVREWLQRCDYHVIVTGLEAGGKSTLIHSLRQRFPNAEPADWIPVAGCGLESVQVKIEGKRVLLSTATLGRSPANGEASLVFRHLAKLNAASRKKHATRFICVVDAADARALSIEWSIVGELRPTTGRQLDNPALAAALHQRMLTAEGTGAAPTSRLDVSWAQVMELGPRTGLRCDDFVHVGSSYLQAGGQMSLLRLRQELDSFFFGHDEFKECPILFLLNKHDLVSGKPAPATHVSLCFDEGIRLHEMAEDHRPFWVLPCTAFAPDGAETLVRGLTWLVTGEYSTGLLD